MSGKEERQIEILVVGAGNIGRVKKKNLFFILYINYY